MILTGWFSGLTLNNGFLQYGYLVEARSLPNKFTTVISCCAVFFVCYRWNTTGGVWMNKLLAITLFSHLGRMRFNRDYVWIVFTYILAFLHFVT